MIDGIIMDTDIMELLILSESGNNVTASTSGGIVSSNGSRTEYGSRIRYGSIRKLVMGGRPVFF